MTTLLFDEGPGAGLGHRRRMEALASALHERGHSCRLAALPAAVVPIRARLVVVDSYRARADELPVEARTLAAVDDLARDLAVDVLIDPSPGATGAIHRSARSVLAGGDYALVSRPEPRVPVVPASAAVERVLVTTGATDVDGAGARMAAAVRAEVGDAEVRLVVGRWGAADVPAGVTGVVAPASLSDELAAAPIVVTAGGVSMLEACLLGRVVVAVVLAGNQRVAVESLAAAGAVVPAGVDDVATIVAGLARDASRREQLAAAARRAIDGLGARRVAEELTA